MEAIRIETGAHPTAAVLWLHGLGADGHDFEPIVPELDLSGLAPVRFVFPHAPVRPVTLNGGMAMRAWYDILQLGGGPEDAKGIQASQRLLEDLIQQEKDQGIGSERIVLAGFSQGGAIALQTALRHPARLAGVMALSTYLAIANTLAGEKSGANQDLPIFMAHGSQDDVIPLRRAEDSRRMLEAQGYAVEWRTYPMPHSVCAPEIADLSAFLRRVLG